MASSQQRDNNCWIARQWSYRAGELFHDLDAIVAAALRGLRIGGSEIIRETLRGRRTHRSGIHFQRHRADEIAELPVAPMSSPNWTR